jgi:hypothetical protein
MYRHLSLLAVLAATLLAPASAHAYVLGAADGSTEAAPLAAQLGARTYRLVMDSTQPLDSYAPRIEAYRAQGLRPQFVVDGTGTDVRGRHGQNWQTINYAIHAFRRWPDAYSVSVMNEPNESGISACQYGRTFRRAYKMLKRAGVPRVLFGEWSPNSPMAWTSAMLTRCHLPRLTADGFAWHCYGPRPNWTGITEAPLINRYLRSVRDRLHTPRGFTLPIYCTEYGVITRGVYSDGLSDPQGASRWALALRLARKYHLAQIVAWGITEAPLDATWDSSIVRADGSPRPAFATLASAR